MGHAHKDDSSHSQQPGQHYWKHAGPIGLEYLTGEQLFYVIVIRIHPPTTVVSHIIRKNKPIASVR